MGRATMYKLCGPVCEIKSKHMVGLSFQNQQLMQNFGRHNPSIFFACTVTNYADPDH